MKILSKVASMLLLSTFAFATSFYEQPFPDAVKEAQMVARGVIGANYVDWGQSADGQKRIYTYYELKVEEVFKGSLEVNTIAMRELGGEKDGVGMQIAGTAQFSRGEDVVVFLSSEPNSDGSYDLRGMMMAKFGIRREDDGSEVLSGPGITGSDHGHSAGDSHVDSAQAKSRFTLDDLRKIVKDQGSAPANPKPRATPPTPFAPPTPATPNAAVTDPADQLVESPQTEIRSVAVDWLLRFGIMAFGISLVLFLRRRKRRK